MKNITAICIALSCTCMSTSANNITQMMSRLQGYTIIGTFDIEGWADKNGKRGDSFEGCEYNRIIIFSGDKALTCLTYHYHYAYKPEATILSNGFNFKMIVDDEIYDMSNF